MLPPLQQFSNATLALVARLDLKKRSNEPRWVRSGDFDHWLDQISGSAHDKSVMVSDWRGKIHVVDPDPVSDDFFTMQLQRSVFSITASDISACSRYLGICFKRSFKNQIERLCRNSHAKSWKSFRGAITID